MQCIHCACSIEQAGKRYCWAGNTNFQHCHRTITTDNPHSASHVLLTPAYLGEGAIYVSSVAADLQAEALRANIAQS